MKTPQQRWNDTKRNGYNKNLKIAMDGLLANVKKGSDVWSWTMTLAELLNQTEMCPKCNGDGGHAKHMNCYHSSHDRYVRGCGEILMCKRCTGLGRIPKKDGEYASDGN
jgi:hypothetical protein